MNAKEAKQKTLKSIEKRKAYQYNDIMDHIDRCAQLCDFFYEHKSDICDENIDKLEKEGYTIYGKRIVKWD